MWLLISLSALLVWFLGDCSVILFYKKRIPRVGKSPWWHGLAQARKDFLQNARELTKEGFSKYKDSMYWMQTGDIDRLILSSRFVNELRSLSEEQLGSKEAITDRHHGWYNGLDVIRISNLHSDVCRVQLTQNLSTVTDIQVKDIDQIMRKEFSQCFDKSDEFHYYNCFSKIFAISNKTISKILVGEPLCYSEAWLKADLGYTTTAFRVSSALDPYPAILRPFVYYSLPVRKELNQHINVAIELIKQHVQSRDQNEKSPTPSLLQWLISSSPAPINHHLLSRQILFLGLASKSSTSMAIINAMFDVASMPQHHATLLTEIHKSIKTHDGFTYRAISSMHKLDSFIKESLRLNFPALWNFNRYVKHNIRLSSGDVLPKGTHLSMPAYWLARDPAVFDDPESFNPWRFSTPRRKADEAGDKSAGQYKMTATSPEFLLWGYGRNACPGRFMAANQMTLIIAWMLYHFEIKLEDGVSKPQPVFTDEKLIPSRDGKIGLKLRHRHGQ